MVSCSKQNHTNVYKQDTRSQVFLSVSVPKPSSSNFLAYTHSIESVCTFSEIATKSSARKRPADGPSSSSRRFFPYRSLWHSETAVWVPWTLRLDNIDQRMVTASCREKQRIGGWALWERSPTGHNTLQTWRQALRSVLLVSERHYFERSCIFLLEIKRLS